MRQLLLRVRADSGGQRSSSVRRAKPNVAAEPAEQTEGEGAVVVRDGAPEWRSPVRRAACVLVPAVVPVVPA